MCRCCNATGSCQELPDELKSHHSVIALMEMRYLALEAGGGGGASVVGEPFDFLFQNLLKS